MALTENLESAYRANAWRVAKRWRLRTRPTQFDIHGIQLEVDSGWHEPTLLGLYRGEYEAAEVDVMRRTLRPHDRYFEIGASIGVTMTVACTIVGDANVTAVEADPQLVDVARRTAQLNGYHPTVINAVLGDDDASQTFYVRDYFLVSSVFPHEDARPVQVPGRILEAELAAARATYLMIDIEGAETQLLCAPLPATVRALCLEVHPDRVGDRAIQDVLQGLMTQGFVLDTRLGAPQVVFFTRQPLA